MAVPASAGPATWNVTDAHAHFFSHGFYRALLAERPGSGPPGDADVDEAVKRAGLEPPPREPAALAARWIAEMDRHGVRQAVLIASVPSDWTSVADAVRLHPDRFAGYAMVQPLAGGALETAERALDEGVLRGICLFPALHRFRIYDPPALRVIEAARKRRAVVFCHFGILRIPVRERLGLPSRFDGTCAVPTDLHRVAADFPDVIFQVPHFGAGYFRETLLLGAQCPNVVADTAGSNAWMRHLGHPLDLPGLFRAALDAFGPERILWGSDSSAFPRGWRRDIFDQQLTALRSIGCDESDLRAILGKNARRLLGLPEPPA